MVDYVTNHLGQDVKDAVYEVIFAIDPDDKADSDRAFDELGLWQRFSDLLIGVTVVDPACGSGSFLVGMLNVLDDLTERANSCLGISMSRFERKKQIIGRNLYGVDVMEWACHVAELRLWLSLIVDADFKPEELHQRREPLLPHFSFKIRCGDSLVQEVAGFDLSHSANRLNIPGPFTKRIDSLKHRKLGFYANDPSCAGDSAEVIQDEERKLFSDILKYQRERVSEGVASLKAQLDAPAQTQLRFDGTAESRTRQMSLRVLEWEREVDALSSRLQDIDRTCKALEGQKQLPFVWDIAFVEIFEGEKRGFDIVIGNPPYVRQESIADPVLRGASPARGKQEYKDMLARSVYRAFPSHFEYRLSTDSSHRTLDRQSDLYIYFYFRGLSLLNSLGSLCFVTSNSWLDVEYGADLQEFLLRHCRIKMILDNLAKRSFSSASINTTIALLSAPDESGESILGHAARFVMFKVPFEQVLLFVPAIAFQDIDNAGQTSITPDYRIRLVAQRDLLQEGFEQAEMPRSVYRGSKWGARHLRAPEIFDTVMRKGKGNLVRLGELANIRRGFTTGANSFFYLSLEQAERWGIEDDFLRPVLKSPKEVKSIYVPPESLSTRVFVCSQPKSKLEGTAALKYIQWGETQKSGSRQKQQGGVPLPDLPTMKGRRYWYELKPREPGDFFCNRFFSDRLFFSYSDGVIEDQTFYAGTFLEHKVPLELAMAVLNCSVVYLSASLLGRVALGEGVLQYAVYEMADLIVVNPMMLDPAMFKTIITSFSSMKRRGIKRVDIELQSPDRQQIDMAIFEHLGLTQGECDAVYESVIGLVESRTGKAQQK